MCWRGAEPGRMLRSHRRHPRFHTACARPGRGQGWGALSTSTKLGTPSRRPKRAQSCRSCDAARMSASPLKTDLDGPDSKVREGSGADPHPRAAAADRGAERPASSARRARGAGAGTRQGRYAGRCRTSGAESAKMVEMSRRAQSRNVTCQFRLAHRHHRHAATIPGRHHDAGE